MKTLIEIADIQLVVETEPDLPPDVIRVGSLDGFVRLLSLLEAGARGPAPTPVPTPTPRIEEILPRTRMRRGKKNLHLKYPKSTGRSKVMLATTGFTPADVEQALLENSQHINGLQIQLLKHRYGLNGNPPLSQKEIAEQYGYLQNRSMANAQARVSKDIRAALRRIGLSPRRGRPRRNQPMASVLST